ncbi:hypothetical protein J6590_098487 [Homalodisca vitripennis]|nr:hypothetical protein J6590_098487 [Homalodisca vitripennis]
MLSNKPAHYVDTSHFRFMLSTCDPPQTDPVNDATNPHITSILHPSASLVCDHRSPNRSRDTDAEQQTRILRRYCTLPLH